MIYIEKTIFAGEYLEIDIVPCNVGIKMKDVKIEKSQMIIEKQKKLNDKNAIRRLHQVALNNFTNKDYHLSLTYNDENMPQNEEQAKKDLANFFRRVKRKVKTLERKDIKYIAVTEKKNKDGTKCRIHHHIIINNSLSRDELEECWKTGRGKNRKSIGFANADKLQFSEDGIMHLIKYITKNTGGKWQKKWISSNNLIRPEVLKKGRTFVKMDMLYSEDASYWERKYKGYKFLNSKVIINDIIKKPYLYLNMVKKDSELCRNIS